jgi:hypothetical protein
MKDMDMMMMTMISCRLKFAQCSPSWVSTRTVYDFDADGGSESGQLIDDDEESGFLGPECPEVSESGREDAEGIDQIEEEGPEIVLHGDDGYEEVGMKNDGYNFWRGIEYDPVTRKFQWDPDDSDHREVPKASEWTRVPPSKMKELKVTFNRGKDALLDQFIEETNAFKARLKELNIPQTKEGLFNHLFGERSQFAQVMTGILEISYEEYARFIATVGFTAEFKQSAERLENDSRINFDGYMEASKCNEIWRKIAVAGKDGTGDKLSWRRLSTGLPRTTYHWKVERTEL